MKKNKSNKIVAFLALAIVGLSVAFTAPNDELKDILVTLSQLNVAIAVGIGALSIGYVKVRKAQSKLAEVTIAIVTLSLLTFLIAHIDWFFWINRTYLILNIIVISSLLLTTLSVIEKEKK